MELRLDRRGASMGQVRLFSFLFMGLAHLLVLKQYVKGAFFALIELAFIAAIPMLVRSLIGLVTLGEPQPDIPVRFRDHSMFMMIEGIIAVAVILVFLLVYMVSIKSAKSIYKDYCIFGYVPGNKKTITMLGDKAFPIVALSPMIILLVFFVVVPLVFSAAVAFTNYSLPSNIPPANTVDWVGLDTFESVFANNSEWSGAFGRVAVWTLVWAVAATLTCYAGGLFMAVILQESRIRIKPFFRAIFILPYAVPVVLSMLLWRNILNGSFGILNRTLLELGWITESTMIPWLSDPRLAKFTVILVNLWAGFPYFMLLSMGTMTSIPKDMYEAAKIDGANNWQAFRSITLPKVIYQTMPLIIMSFTHNVNNFGAIFFLTGGNPSVADTPVTKAKGTDLLVTWIYELTINMQWYNVASVLVICIFVVLAPFAIFNFVRTKSFKEGEA